MKVARAVISVTAVFSMTYIITRLYLGSASSERFWTWLNNQLSAGEDPGLASDVELLIALICALIVSTIVVLAALGTWKAIAKHRAS